MAMKPRMPLTSTARPPLLVSVTPASTTMPSEARAGRKALFVFERDRLENARFLWTGRKGAAARLFLGPWWRGRNRRCRRRGNRLCGRHGRWFLRFFRIAHDDLPWALPFRARG